MRHFRTFLTAMTLFATLFIYAEPNTITLEFNANDFNIVTDASGITHITSLKEVSSNHHNQDPELPVFSSYFTIEPGYTYVSSSLQIATKPLRFGVTLPSYPEVETTNEPISTQPQAYAAHYSPGIYPSENFKVTSANYYEDKGILYVKYCPFVYNTRNKALYLIERMDITLNLHKNGHSQSDNTSNVMHKSRWIGNRPDTLIVKPGVTQDTVRNDMTEHMRFPDYDYIILTNENLKDAFEPLARWKTSKGVNTIVQTVESIEGYNTSKDKPLVIKRYLWYMKRRFDIDYVLFGGDDTVIPVRYCYGRYTNGHSYYIPTDLYYAALGKTESIYRINSANEPDKGFDWNLDGNSTYGEFSDSIDMTPRIYLSRVPVQTPEDATNFVNKLLRYETSPSYQHRMLNAGAILSYYNDKYCLDPSIYDPLDPSTHSDSEMASDLIYEHIIQPRWNGTRVKFFDTGTSFSGDRLYDLTPDNLRIQLATGGYDFVSLFCHGQENALSLDNEQTFDCGHALTVNNFRNSSIITTIACFTNAFDSWKRFGGGFQPNPIDPCISEAFIRNPNSGVIAYFGGSREGLRGASHEFESLFYHYLFSDEITEKNYGRIAAAVKMAKIAASSEMGLEYGDVKNNSNRWVQFSINPIGDPEMPIYTTHPTGFSAFNITESDNEITINTGVENCRICIMGLDNSNYYNVFKNVEEITLNKEKLPSQFSVGVTKQNYVPLLYSVVLSNNSPLKAKEVTSIDQMMLKDMGCNAILPQTAKIVSCTPNSGSQTATVELDMENAGSTPQIIITSLTGNHLKTVEVGDNESAITFPINSLPMGVHVVSLVVDGQCVDSTRLIKK